MGPIFEKAKANRISGRLFAKLAAGTVIAPGLQGQKPGDTIDSTAVAWSMFVGSGVALHFRVF